MKGEIGETDFRRIVVRRFVASPVNENPEDTPQHEAIDLGFDTRAVDTEHAISALRKYLELMEQQMAVVQVCERATLEADRPPGNDEDEQSIFWQELNYLEQLFEDDLIPTMRYSFLVFLHTVFETRLRAFCSAMQHEKQLPLDLTDIRGSAIDQARIYLAKLVSITVADFPEWQHLRTFQLVRDCIVHHYGYLVPDDPRHKQIRDLAAKNVGVSVTHDDRILLDPSFCQQHLSHIEDFFRRLFESAGWRA